VPVLRVFPFSLREMSTVDSVPTLPVFPFSLRALREKVAP
jgi:hypothetical protein